MSGPDAPSFPIAVARLPQDGLDVGFEADAAERAAIAARFGVPAVERFAAALHAARWQDGGVAVTGTLSALAVQTDVVTLDEVRQTIEEPVELYFVPEHSRLAPRPLEAGELDLDPGDETIEVFRGERIELGEPLVQLLGVALDPYPRGAGVSFEPEADGGKEPSPFAVLARLREPKGE